MISGSNEQLQLECTLLMPDCHSWSITKMQSDTLEERYAIKFCFKLGKTATETYGILQTVFGASCMNQASVFKLHKRFKEVRESVKDDERCGRSKGVRTPELIGQRVRVRVTPGPVLDFGPERGPGKGTMADLGPLIRHLVSTRLPSGERAAFLSPLSPMHGTRPSV